MLSEKSIEFCVSAVII